MEKQSTFEDASNSNSLRKSSYSGIVISAITRPSGTAPDSPVVIGVSPLIGAPPTRIPSLATQSGADTNTSAWFLKISQETVFGSPHASPAMIVSKSPSTIRGLPSSATAPLYKQAAASASTTTNLGFLVALLYKLVK